MYEHFNLYPQERRDIMAEKKDTTIKVIDLITLAMHTAILIPDPSKGIINAAAPRNGTDFQLQELYELLGTDDIEIVRLPDSGLQMIIDGEGKLKDRPINVVATTLWHYHLPESRQNDVLAGPVLLCKTEQVK